MISPTGKNKGFTFIEMMVTLAVLSVGIVFIYKSFLVSIDQLEYLTQRLYATVLLDNQFSAIERNLKIYKALPVSLNESLKIPIGPKTITYKQGMNIKEVEDYPDVFSLTLVLSWSEQRRQMTLERTGYISDMNYESSN